MDKGGKFRGELKQSSTQCTNRSRMGLNSNWQTRVFDSFSDRTHYIPYTSIAYTICSIVQLIHTRVQYTVYLYTRLDRSSALYSWPSARRYNGQKGPQKEQRIDDICMYCRQIIGGDDDEGKCRLSKSESESVYTYSKC